MNDKLILSWALFRASDGREWVSVWGELTEDVFTDGSGARWERIAGPVQAATRREAEALLRKARGGV